MSHLYVFFWASLMPQLVKNPPAMWETWVLSLGWDDPLKEEMATHSSILAWRIPWAEELVHGILKSLTGLSEIHIHDQVNYGIFEFRTYRSL